MEHVMMNHGTQFELFPFSQGRPAAIARPRYLSKDLTLSVENTIVLCIIFIMTVVLFFSFGVERGKRIVKSSLAQAVEAPAKSPVAAAANVQIPAPAVVEKAIKPGMSPGKLAPADAQAAPQKKESGAFTIQVASFKDRDSARKEAKVLKQKGYQIFVLPKGSHSIVCVGKFVLRDEAREFSNNLKSRYNDCLVRRL
ncbi:MAG: SPOR domain-containing protein [Candidatus Omnitrophica bacterium]|nr:SPOR domain-containing protein [Candidatus Omnitrophota bacterium]